MPVQGTEGRCGQGWSLDRLWSRGMVRTKSWMQAFLQHTVPAGEVMLAQSVLLVPWLHPGSLCSWGVAGWARCSSGCSCMGCKTAGNLVSASSCFCRASTRVVAAGDGFSWSSWCPQVCFANISGLRCISVIPTKGWDRGVFCPLIRDVTPQTHQAQV